MRKLVHDTDRGDENCWIGKENGFIEYSFKSDTYVKEVRLIPEETYGDDKYRIFSFEVL